MIWVISANTDHFHLPTTSVKAEFFVGALANH